MERKRAMQILNITESDDRETVKRKYRRLMGRFHPDTLGSQKPEQVRRAQEINEAYQVLKKCSMAPAQEKKGRERKARWSAKINAGAFCDRNIYLYYTMDLHGDELYYRTACGKYLWDPQEEAYALFMKSIYHATKELLDSAEERAGCCKEVYGAAAEKRFEVQTRLFHCLLLEFTDPVSILRKRGKPERKDSEGREIYHVPAFLEADGRAPSFPAVEGLKTGEMIFPEGFRENRLQVRSRMGQSLGYLVFDEDSLYLSLIPLLKNRQAQVKIVVKRVDHSRSGGSRRVRAATDFYLRLEAGWERYRNRDQNPQISSLLNQYEDWLKQWI